MSISGRLGVGAQTGRGLPSEKAVSGGYTLGGLMRVWVSWFWAGYLVPSLPSVRAAAATGCWPSEAPLARAGPVLRAGGVLRAAARSAGAAAAAPCGRSGGVSGAKPAGRAAGATA